MSPNQCAEFLSNYNLWRRGDADDEDAGKIEMPHPRELGLAIDRAVELINQSADIETLKQENLQVLAGLDRVTAERDELIATANAVIDRWNSPQWKDIKHTADYIYALSCAAKKAQP